MTINRIRRCLITMAVLTLFSGIAYAGITLAPKIDTASYFADTEEVEISGQATCAAIVIEIWNLNKELISFSSTETTGAEPPYDWSADIGVGVLPNGTYTVKAANY